MASGKAHRLILCNDGGTLVGPTVEAPIGAEGLARLAIGPLRDTQIDTFYWQLGTDPYLGTPSHRLSDQYSHDTAVGPRWGQGATQFSTASNWRIYESTRQMSDAGADPAAVVIEHGHRAGLEVFLSMRVNDAHDARLEGGLDDPLMSPMKRAHRDWILGRVGDRRAEDPRLDGREARARTSYNFAVPEVRDYKLALAGEAIANYDLDGLDWDFCRYPTLFPEGQEHAGSPLLTDLMREVRAAVDGKRRQTGRPVQFSARIPGSLDQALSVGMDVRAWLAEGLLDILIVGHTLGNKHRLPVEEYVEAARDTGTQVIAQNLGLFMQPRPPSARLLWNERDYYSTEMCRATAAAHWRAGADGIYLFNNHLIAFARDLNHDRQPWKEIADPVLIARKDKHYLVDHREWAEGPLPATLERPGDEAEVSIDIADDLVSAASDGALKTATLRLLVEQLTVLDELRFDLNGTTLDPSLARTRLLYNDAWLEFDVSPPLLRQGWNRLSVKVIARNPSVDCRLVLTSAEVLVSYRIEPADKRRPS